MRSIWGHFRKLSRFVLALLGGFFYKGGVFYEPRLKSVRSLPQRAASGGFTLLELLVVLFILGVLVSLAFPHINSMVEQTRKIRCSSRLEMIDRAKTSYVVDNLAGQSSFTHVSLEDLPQTVQQGGSVVALQEERKAVFRMYFMEPFPFTCPVAPTDSPVGYQDVYHLYKSARCPYCEGAAP